MTRETPLLTPEQFLEVIRPAIDAAQRFEDGPAGQVRPLPQAKGPTIAFRRPVPFKVTP